MSVLKGTEGTKRDFGLVGFHPGKGTQYLIFPKSLRAFKDRRMAGIKYDLLQRAEPIGRVISDEWNPKSFVRGRRPEVIRTPPARVEEPGRTRLGRPG